MFVYFLPKSCAAWGPVAPSCPCRWPRGSRRHTGRESRPAGPGTGRRSGRRCRRHSGSAPPHSGSRSGRCSRSCRYIHLNNTVISWGARAGSRQNLVGLQNLGFCYFKPIFRPKYEDSTLLRNHGTFTEKIWYGTFQKYLTSKEKKADCCVQNIFWHDAR